MYKHGFFDENILALKIDSIEEYVFFVNESNSGSELNSFDGIVHYLNKKYIDESPVKNKFQEATGIPEEKSLFLDKYIDISPSSVSVIDYKTKQGTLTLTKEYFVNKERIIRAKINGETAPDGRYELGFMFHVTVKDGIVV